MHSPLQSCKEWETGVSCSRATYLRSIRGWRLGSYIKLTEFKIGSFKRVTLLTATNHIFFSEVLSQQGPFIMSPNQKRTKHIQAHIPSCSPKPNHQSFSKRTTPCPHHRHPLSMYSRTPKTSSFLQQLHKRGLPFCETQRLWEAVILT